MNKAIRAGRTLGMVLVGAWCLCLSGCEGDYSIPITAGPTRQIDQRLLGNWLSQDGKEQMKVRKFDDATFVVSYEGEFYRAYHSDLGSTAFLSAQDIDSPTRKYVYLAYKLSEDGRHLNLRAVDENVIPKETKDSVSVQILLKKNLQGPKLFGDEAQYVRQK